MIIAGRIGDVYGRRRIFYVGLLILAISSVAAGFATSFWILISFRAVQSLGVAAIVTLAPSLIHDLFKDHAHYPMSIYIAITGAALCVGPYIGGIITHYFGWRWIFYINFPLLLIAFLFCLLSLPSIPPQKRPLDLKGAALLGASLILLVFGLTHGESEGWNNFTTIVCISLSILGFYSLRKVEARSNYPILDLALFKKKEFVLAAFSCVMAGLLISPALFFSPLYLQNLLGLSAQAAGALLLIMPIGVALCAPLVGKIVGKCGTKGPLLSSLIVALLACFFYVLFGALNQIVYIIFAFLLTGFAWVLTNVAAPLGAANSVEPSRVGVSIGTILSLWNLFAAISLAIATIIFHETTSKTSLNNFPISFSLIFSTVGLAIVMLLFTLALHKKTN